MRYHISQIRKKNFYIWHYLSLIPSFVWLILLTFFWGKYLYLHGLKITGPFIFADESTYASFARNIAEGKSILSFTQYGPLYPLLTSPLFLMGNMVSTYKLIKIFNIFAFISSVIPAYLLGKTLFTNLWLRTLLPVIVLITPFSGLVYLIWAEPLYIPLFYWTCFLLCTFTKNPTATKGLVLALLAALLYYTKPAAGLIVEIAILLTLFLYITFTWNTNRKKNIILTSAILLTYIAFTLPWMLHYHHLGLSIVGYPSATHALSNNLLKLGYFTFIMNFFYGLFYQFSYVIVGSLGLIGICFGLGITEWKQLNPSERCITLFILLSTLGLIALSALGMASFPELDYKMPNGRYFSLLFPLLIALTLHLLFKTKPQKFLVLFFIILLTTLITFVASPLYSRSPLAFNSMPELSAIIYIIDNKLVSWRAIIEEPSFSLRLNVALIFGGFALCVMLLRRWTYAPLLTTIAVIYGMWFATGAEQYYIRSIAIGQSGLNNVYIYIVKNNIPSDVLRFDKKLELGNVAFMTQFWLNNIAKYKSADAITKSAHNKKFSYFISDQTLPLEKQFSSYQYSIYKMS
jgi:hypothetical protein